MMREDFLSRVRSGSSYRSRISSPQTTRRFVIQDDSLVAQYKLREI